MKEKTKSYQKETNKQIELLANNINKLVVVLTNKNNNIKDNRTESEKIDKSKEKKYNIN